VRSALLADAPVLLRACPCRWTQEVTLAGTASLARAVSIHTTVWRRPEYIWRPAKYLSIRGETKKWSTT